MKQFLLGVMFILTAAVSYAQADLSLDDFMSPDEIAAEVRQQNPKFLEETYTNRNMLFMVSSPRVKIYINKARQGTSDSAQTMWVYVDGELYSTWPVSTGREKNEAPPSGRDYFSSTPLGTWTPRGTTRRYKSKTWDADMPYSIWVTGGIAIHAASRSAEGNLGSRASGGCIRLQFENAAELFEIVETYGIQNVRVKIFTK